MGKIAEWIWPEVREQRLLLDELRSGIKIRDNRIALLETELGDKTLKLEKLQRERAAFIRPNTPEVLRNVTAAQIRRMTEKEGERDGI